MKGGKNGASNMDLLVCFPKRAPLMLMHPKAIEASKRQNSTRHVRNKSLPGVGIGRGSHCTSLSKLVADPTSPEVTCSGQIKGRKSGGVPAGNWKTLMHEMERIHKRKKQSSFMGLGFLSCLRSLRIDFRCFRAFPKKEAYSSEEEEEEYDEREFDSDSMVESIHASGKSIDVNAPPLNALVLMRCRSTPLKVNRGNNESESSNKGKDLRSLIELEKKVEWEVDVNKQLYDIAKDKWVALRRSNSWSE